MSFDLVVEGEAVLASGVEHAQIGIREGLIAEIKKSGLRGKMIDASGCLVFPGFIDPHVHLREPGWDKKEDFSRGSMAAIHGGVTTMFDMPNNPIPAATPETLRKKRRLAKQAPVDILFFGAVTPQNLHSLAEVKDLVVGYKIYLAETTGNILLPSELLPEALAEISGAGKPASIHCEDQSTIESRRKRFGAMDSAERHGLIRNPESEEEAVRKVLSLLSLKSRRTRVNVCHVSTVGASRLIARCRADGGGANLTAEVTLHHLYFSERALKEKGNLLKVNPPIRSEADRAGMLEALRDGTIDFLVTDHAPHLLAEKMAEENAPSGVPGLDNYGNIVAWLITDQGIPPSRIAEVTSGNQARFFGLKDRGELAKGKRADITILDPRLKERITRDSLYTKCHWSPYEEVEFSGRARWTIRDGRVVQDDCQLIA